MTELAPEVRTLDEFFHRIIVVDRRTAIIPSAHELATALAIREPTVVAYLVDVFMRSWERARPFTSRDVSVAKQIADEQRAMTMRMLVEGYSDPVSAKRLGVSPRTYAGYVADLKEEFDAETRFQLGYTLGRLGIPTDGVDPDSDQDGLRTCERGSDRVTAPFVSRVGPGGWLRTRVGGRGPRLGGLPRCGRQRAGGGAPADVCLSRCGDPEKAEAQSSGRQDDGHFACDLHAHSTFESFRDPLTGPVDRFSLVLHRYVGGSLAHKHALQFVAPLSGWPAPELATRSGTGSASVPPPGPRPAERAPATRGRDPPRDQTAAAGYPAPERSPTVASSRRATPTLRR